MTNLNKILAAVAFVTTLSLVNAAMAGDNNDHKILTTPRQAWLVTHVWWVKGTPATPIVPVGYAKYADYYVTTSPKDYQRIDEERAQLRAQENAPQQAEVARIVGYRATGDDGITASPKFRQFLDEHKSVTQMAPLK